jgi:hypothetical protein
MSTDSTDRITSRFGARTTALEVVQGVDLGGRGGRYLEDCNEGLPATPGNRIAGWMPHARDPEAARRLWDQSVRLLATA